MSGVVAEFTRLYHQTAAFKLLLTTEFIPADHTRRARDKLRKLKQVGSVDKYLSEFRNIVLMIADMHEGEKLDKFVEGLKYNVRVEVLKSGCNQFEECARMALNVDSAIWGARRTLEPFTPTRQNAGSTHTPMEIGNVNGSGSSQPQREQRRKDLMTGSCFKCHKKGCRPWRCDSLRVNHVSMRNNDPVPEESRVVLSDSENE